ncbi:MAG: hypothetical protein A2381_09665 [Bdellovibrionales bacterium RIFOXYB1_FULL_37_110]|nr:MAG: hypothetical protein A2181_02745 [Bdellovibrionales bacterium RIFOXYA1_FULL_38_20]OFZ47214.1 MAG: hypothetical protein A2417_06855 [Bdellovibrionales bacterium RIFOXYC1_FULL_37_79]OFZ59536.1 MAG: hypothetical protein A2381_09665 [Bdellovibrionales bacterium RIFOXYB1_FULL_37_110]OFZ62485.1 MAG: hypothetical protein A2577_03590 [Bdellovibrionales bacterium RIFOXYD1_FULL_36_51]
MEKMAATKIICQTSLQAYFLDKLVEVNQKLASPLSPEVLLYSSQVLDTFSDPQNIFEVYDGKKSVKILGLKLLESEKLPKSKRKKILMDVGDTALFICGFFYESLNRKLFQIRYYHDLGKKAYAKLDGISLKSIKRPSIFGMMASSFDNITDMITIVSKMQCTSEDDKTSGTISYMINDKNKLKAS